eukprot:gene31375-41823_t
MTSSNINSSPLFTVQILLQQRGIDAFIVGSGDAHQSEYVCHYDMRRQFVSGFTGSAGTALVIAQGKSLLWTDGRYFSQAEMQLSDEWLLMRSGQPNVLEINDWIVENLPTGSVVGFDPFLMSTSQAKALIKVLKLRGITIKCCSGIEGENPVDIAWNALGTRPPFPKNALRILEVKNAGIPHSIKILAVQKLVIEKNAVAILITMLDEIAWLFNIRGSDISFNPVTIAYAVITRDSAVLFIDAAKVTPEITAHLGDGVQLRPYEDICSFLKEIVSQGSGPVLMDPSRANWGVYLAVEEGDSNSPEEKVASSLAVRMVDIGSPITFEKSLKNESELAGIRACH